jgi:hypothetical protein
MLEKQLISYEHLDGIITDLLWIYQSRLEYGKLSPHDDDSKQATNADIKEDIEKSLDRQISHYSHVYRDSGQGERFNDMRQTAIGYIDKFVDAKIDANEQMKHRFKTYFGTYAKAAGICYMLGAVVCGVAFAGGGISISSLQNAFYESPTLYFAGIGFGTIVLGSVFSLMGLDLAGNLVHENCHQSYSDMFAQARKDFHASFEAR